MTLRYDQYNQKTQYDNPALLAWYEFGDVARFNRMESRIHILYQRLKLGIKPWEWDWWNYSGNNADMVGFFYDEDINAIEQLKDFERERESKQK